MTGRADFTDEEWYRVRAAPWQVAMGVVEVDPHGSFTAGRELRAAEAEFARADRDAGAADLIRLVARAITDQDDEDTGVPPQEETDAGPEGLPERVLPALGALVEVLDAKVEADEAAAYRRWLLDVATLTAKAAKEGFRGIAGRKISPVEQDYLDRLRAVLAPSA